MISFKIKKQQSVIMLETKYSLCTSREPNSFNINSCVLLIFSETVDVNEQVYKQALKHSS